MRGKQRIKTRAGRLTDAEMERMREYRRLCREIEAKKELIRHIRERATNTVAGFCAAPSFSGGGDKVSSGACNLVDAERELREMTAREARMRRSFSALFDEIPQNERIVRDIFRMYVFDGIGFAQMERAFSFRFEQKHMRMMLYRAIMQTKM